MPLFGGLCGFGGILSARFRASSRRSLVGFPLVRFAMPDIDPLVGPKLKIKRADAHIHEIHRAYKAFRESNPYGGFVEKDEKAGQLIYKFRALKPIPPDFPTIVGDAIQNLRAALDHAACCLAIQNDPTVNINDVSFPIAGDIDEFKTRAKKTIKKLSPEAITFIHDLKPYKGGNDQFWRLHRLGVRDRHRLLLATWSGRGAVGFRTIITVPKTGEKVISPRVFIQPLHPNEPLEDGSPIFAIPISEAGKTIDDEVHFQVDVVFGDGEVVIAEPIGPALIQLRDFVWGVISAIEKRFFSTS